VLLFLLITSGFSEQNKLNVTSKSKGEKIYKELCIECHGDQGQGVKDKCDDPLYGNRTLESLTKRIERTMPEDNEEACVGPDAMAVADYIYDAFYSPKAHSHLLAHIKPKLQRLTVSQYKRTVTDLITSFRQNYRNSYRKENWVTVTYGGRHPTEMKDEKKIWVKHNENASTIEKQFSDKSPYDDLDRTENIDITYQGSIIAEKTGWHEFFVRSQNGFSFWINEPHWKATAQIDGSVVSGKDIRELSYRAYLMQGWAYPIKLKWKISGKESQASMQLLWKAPDDIKELIPTRVLNPVFGPKVAVVSTVFPPDDASRGYEMGLSISKPWQESIVKAATEASGLITSDLDALASTNPTDKERDIKIKLFCEKFVERALRKPLNEELKKYYIEDIFKGLKDVDLATKRVVLLTLCSAEFLYPEVGKDKPNDYDIASRLALTLWDSLPDEKLIEEAKQGKLTKIESIEKQAARMIQDRRAQIKLSGFFDHWLELDRAKKVTKDESVFPEFNPQLLSDLRVSLEMFLKHVVWSDTSDYRELLTADYLYLNDRLKKLYDGQEEINLPSQGDFKAVKVGDRRSGVITHPYLLTAFAYHNSTSPIHRGVFLTRNIVGRQLNPPPKAISFSNVKFEPNLTMREKVTHFTKDNTCMSCHALINPLGFSLEHFDGIGRWREKDKNKPINASDDFTDDHGSKMKLNGAGDVAKFAIQSQAAQRTFIQQLFNHLVKQDVSAFGLGVLDDLEKSFKQNNYNIKSLMIKIATLVAASGQEQSFNTVTGK